MYYPMRTEWPMAYSTQAFQGTTANGRNGWGKKGGGGEEPWLCPVHPLICTPPNTIGPGHPSHTWSTCHDSVLQMCSSAGHFSPTVVCSCWWIRPATQDFASHQQLVTKQAPKHRYIVHFVLPASRISSVDNKRDIVKAWFAQKWTVQVAFSRKVGVWWSHP